MIFTGTALKSIKDGAFTLSNKLTKIDLPSSLKTIDKGAFAYMSGLKSIVIPNQVRILPEECFVYCTSLETVTFSGEIKRLGNQAFAGCQNLTSIKFTQKNPPIIGDKTWPFPEGNYWVNADNTARIIISIPKGSMQTYMKAWDFDPKKETAFFKEY